MASLRGMVSGFCNRSKRGRAGWKPAHTYQMVAQWIP